MTFKDQLIALDACKDAIEWVGNRSLQESWEQCERADWLMWLLAKQVDAPNWPTKDEVILFACDCAETALKYTSDDRARAALDVTRAYVASNATLAEVNAAANDAVDAEVNAADACAAYAAYAAANAAYAAADAAANAAYAAADAAAAYAAVAAAYAAEHEAHINMCTIIRNKVISIGEM